MGNCLAQRNLSYHLTFNKNEEQLLNKSFDIYCDIFPQYKFKTRRHISLSQKSFEEIFPENPRFGRRVFIFLEKYGRKEKYITRQTLFELLEIFLKDSYVTANPLLKNFEKIELLSLISIENNNFVCNKEELAKLQITYLQAIEIISDLIRIHYSGQNNPSIDERPIKAFVDAAFKNKEGVMDFFSFIKVIKKQLSGANQMIKFYFRKKFFMKDIKYISPILSSPSYILNEDWLFQLFLAAPKTKLFGTNKLTLLYSNLLHQQGFPQLVQYITESNLPTLTLFQHQDQYVQVHDRSAVLKSSIFGAINNERWSNTAQSNGTDQDCIFSLYPEFRIFFNKKQKNARKDFRYLNYGINKQLPEGIGFGGNGSDFRIWIDQDYYNKSYITTDDKTYEAGHLIQPHIKGLKVKDVNLIEIWGLTKPADDEDLEDEKFVRIDANDPLLAQNQIAGQGEFYWFNDVKSNFYWMQTSSDEENDVEQSFQPTIQVNGEEHITVKINKPFDGTTNGKQSEETVEQVIKQEIQNKQVKLQISNDEEQKQNYQIETQENQEKIQLEKPQRRQRNTREERIRFSEHKRTTQSKQENQPSRNSSNGQKQSLTQKKSRLDGFQDLLERYSSQSNQQNLETNLKQLEKFNNIEIVQNKVIKKQEEETLGRERRNNYSKKEIFEKADDVIKNFELRKSQKK